MLSTLNLGLTGSGELCVDNKALNRAKATKDDEFYTTYTTVFVALMPFVKYLLHHKIFCNCDGYASNFVKFLSDLIGYDNVWFSDVDYHRTLHSYIYDLVITNPPFSKIRDYVSLMLENGIRFILMCPIPSLSSSPIREGLIEGIIDVYPIPGGCRFYRPDGSLVQLNNICVIANVYGDRDEYPLTKLYSPEAYRRYCNYDALFIDRIKDIPKDYMGKMAVPLTYLQYLNRSEFRIIDIFNKSQRPDCEPLGEEFVRKLRSKAHYRAGMRIPRIIDESGAYVPFDRAVIQRVAICD